MATYDPSLYTLVVAGIPIPSDGYADGEFIKIERDVQKFTDVSGTDGSVTRAKQLDRRATCTFSTMQGATINAVLSTLLLADLNSDNEAGIGPFLLKDRNGLTVHEGEKCWIAKDPDVSLDRNPTARPWMIRVAKLESFEGG